MATSQGTITCLYFGTKFFFLNSNKTPPEDVFQLDPSYGMNFHSLTQFDGLSFKSSKLPKPSHYYIQYGHTNVYYCTYPDKINFSHAPLDFFEKYAEISVKSNFIKCEQGVRHHAIFVAALRANNGIFQCDIQDLTEE